MYSSIGTIKSNFIQINNYLITIILTVHRAIKYYNEKFELIIFNQYQSMKLIIIIHVYVTMLLIIYFYTITRIKYITLTYRHIIFLHR